MLKTKIINKNKKKTLIKRKLFNNNQLNIYNKIPSYKVFNIKTF